MALVVPPLGIDVPDSRHSPMEAVLARAGAVLVDHGGDIIASDFGSSAGELALCERAVGIADRADLGVLALSGHPGTLAHVVQRMIGRPLGPRMAVRTPSAWWCPAGEEVLVLCEPSRRTALAAELAQATRLASGVCCRDATDEYAAVSVVGPRARQLLGTVARSDAGPEVDGGCEQGELAGTPVLLLRESPTQYLLVMASTDEPGEWQALLEAGRPLGVGYVGRDALEHHAVRARMQARHRPV